MGHLERAARKERAEGPCWVREPWSGPLGKAGSAFQGSELSTGQSPGEGAKLPGAGTCYSEEGSCRVWQGRRGRGSRSPGPLGSHAPPPGPPPPSPQGFRA